MKSIRRTGGLATFVIAASMVITAMPAAAQEPTVDPTTRTALQTVCITFSTVPGTVIDSLSLADALASGTATVAYVEAGDATDSDCALAAMGDSVAPDLAQDEDPDNAAAFAAADMLVAFAGRQEKAFGRMSDLSDTFTNGLDTASYKTSAKRATSIATYAKKQITWLDANDPAPCYEQMHSDVRAIWKTTRTAYLHIASGLKRMDVDTLSQGVDEMEEATALMEDLDWDSPTCIDDLDA